MRFILVLLVLIAVFFGGLAFIGNAIDRFQCNRLAQNTQIETRHDFFTGCLVKVNDRFIPRENWRGEYEK